jgi:hypothetical protein
MKGSSFVGFLVFVFFSVFVFFALIYPLPVLYAITLAIAATALPAYLFAHRLSERNERKQLPSSQGDLLLDAANQSNLIPRNERRASHSPASTIIYDDEETIQYTRKPYTPYDPDHIAGTKKVSVEDALKMRLIKILNALPIPHAAQLESLYTLGRWEYPTAQELLSRAKINLEKVAEYFLNWAGFYIPRKDATRHFLFCGMTGSGKTTLLKHLMLQALYYVGFGRNQRAIVYDPKRDMVSFLYAFVPSEAIKILNPFDSRCVAWDMASDIRTPTEAQTFAAILIPKENNDKPFFPLAAQQLMSGIIKSFIYTSEERKKKDQPPLEWTLRDVCWAFKNKDIALEVLQKHEQTQEIVEYLERDNKDIDLTLKNYVNQIEAIAAAWDGKEKMRLRKDFLDDKNGKVLILGSSAKDQEAITAINTLMIDWVIASVLDSEEAGEGSKIDPSRTWLFLDEFADLRMQKLVDIFRKTRSKGLCAALTIQDYASVKNSYGDSTTTIVDNCDSQVFLHCKGDTAKQISENIGKERKWERSYTDSSQTADSTAHTTQSGTSHTSPNWGSGSYPSDTTSSGTSTTYTTSHTSGSSVTVQVQERDAVMQGDLTSLKLASPLNGLEGIARCSEMEGYTWNFHYVWGAFQPILDLRSDESDFDDRSKIEGIDFQTLRPFDADDYRRLGLDQEKIERAKRVREQRKKDDELRDLVERVKWRGYMTKDEKEMYNQLDEKEKETVDRIIGNESKTQAQKDDPISHLWEKYDVKEKE